jgi:enoyl-CoA hydratase/carnithine racemase
MTGPDAPAPIRLEPHPADGRLALLRLDRPPLNAFDQRMWDLFADVTAHLHGDTLYRAVVITGGPRHFAAGADVGCELALAADFRFAGRSAVFGLPEITLGIIPGSGGTQRLPRIVGPGRAKEMILSGRTVAADEALAIGLVDQVLDDTVLLDTAVEAGLRYARGPLALRHAKRAVDAALDRPVEDGLALEADLITRCFGSEDGQRGLRSFVDQGPRKATFLGR